ncbi:DinB family protein [Dyadobacter sp. CY326]|uniref:DinB family protein n=1 Tax=Dyadobacter sp. CY326 TaxID=2907300 RepID=UPI001F168FF4|nr:DinB family protein [Dyadobacter sp. CY326]MCE7065138.1 DinB family protein [Dyadobacter sp. CY326]
MLGIFKHSLWTQFGASIDSLRNAIAMWPEAYWNTDTKFFYIAYHSQIMLDYYLTIPHTGEFPSTLPFTFSEPGAQPEGVLGDMVPDRIYTKSEMLSYLDATREKCRVFIQNLTDEQMEERWIEGPEEFDMNYAVPEILFYNMRHVQHHAAQLNMLLRQKIDKAPGWVFRADETP